MPRKTVRWLLLDHYSTPKTLIFIALQTFSDVFLVLGPLILSRLLFYLDLERGGHITTLFLFLTLRQVTITLLSNGGAFLRHKAGQVLKFRVIEMLLSKALHIPIDNETLGGYRVDSLDGLLMECRGLVIIMDQLFLLISVMTQIGLSIVFMLYSAEPCEIFGVVLLLVCLPLMRYVAEKMKASQKKMNDLRNQRVDLVTEIILKIEAVASESLEAPLSKRLYEKREEELRAEISSTKILTFFHIVWKTLPQLATFFSQVFAFYLAKGGRPIFSQSLLTFQILSSSINGVPNMASAWFRLQYSLDRLEAFLDFQEIPNSKIPITVNENIKLEGEELQFAGKYSSYLGRPLSFKIQSNTLNVISGKDRSNVLAGLAGELLFSSGRLRSSAKSIAYVSSIPFLFDDTLRQNILFFRPFVEDEFEKAIFNAGLSDVLIGLPGGENFIVGPHGMCLSGGQQARVAICRAVYGSEDLILFDEPLSAVDVNTRVQVIRNIFGEDGCRKRTFVVATESGMIKGISRQVICCDENEGISNQPASPLVDAHANQIVQEFADLKKYDFSSSESENQKNDGAFPSFSFKWFIKTLRLYFALGNSLRSLAFCGCLFLFAIFLENCAFLSAATYSSFYSQTILSNSWIFFLLAIQAVLYCVAYMHVYHVCQKTSKAIFKKAFDTLLTHPLEYFQSNHSNLMSLFTVDMMCVDSKIQTSVVVGVHMFIRVFEGFFVASVKLPVLAVSASAALPFLLSILTRNVNRCTELEQVTHKCRSRSIQFANELWAGRATCRSLKQEDAMMKRAIDEITSVVNNEIRRDRLRRGIIVQTEIVSMIFLLSIAIVLITERTTGVDRVFLSLALSHSISVAPRLSQFICRLTDLASELQAFQRLTDFTKTRISEEPKPNQVCLGKDFSLETIEIKDVVVKYGNYVALDQVNVQFTKGSITYLAGANGSGKSTLLSCILKIRKIDAGEIRFSGLSSDLIDGKQAVVSH
eukprot:GHVP01030535.1.p1 GENE.GHVP01030535.1~~GHVP01030535.1.p1  ORF type:complete len:983 (-),score=150.58 GHVP01030535.1:877-3825(-)